MQTSQLDAPLDALLDASLYVRIAHRSLKPAGTIFESSK